MFTIPPDKDNNARICEDSIEFTMADSSPPSFVTFHKIVSMVLPDSNFNSNSSEFPTLESRLHKCDMNITPLSREEVRRRLQDHDDDESEHEEPPMSKLMSIVVGTKTRHVQSRPTPINDPIIRDRLIDAEKLEDKIIALDYRLKLDQCLHRSYF